MDTYFGILPKMSGVSVNFVLNILMVVFGALYWWFSLSLDLNSMVTPTPDEYKGKVFTVRIIAFLYSFIVSAWSLRYVSSSSKTGLFWKLGTFVYSVATGLSFYAALTFGPHNEFCQKFVLTVQPLLGALAIVSSVSFGGVLAWLAEHEYLKESLGPKKV